MKNIEELVNLEIVEVIEDNYPQDDWDNYFGDHSISSF